MAHDRTRHCRLTTFALALLLTLSGASGRAQEFARHDLRNPGTSQPIHLAADSVTTWLDGDQRMFLLKGNIWIEQGLVTLRGAQGVAWIDEKGRQATGMYVLELYTEGDVTLDNGPQRQNLNRAQVQLATRGELRIKAYASPVQEKELAGDEIFQRARTAKNAPPVDRAKDAPVMPLPAIAAPPPPAPPTTLPPRSLPPTAAPEILKVQAFQPGPAVQDPGPLPLPDASAVPVPGPIPPPSAPPPSPPPPPRGEASGPPRRFSIRPRTSSGISASSKVENGETAIIVPTGVIITVGEPGDPKGFLDMEADRMVVWTKGNPQQIFANMQSSQGETSNSLEFYLTGNVEIRTQTTSKRGSQQETLRADEVYYDVGRNVAIALRADLEIREPKLPNPIHFQADEFFRINAQLYESNQVQVFSTILPSDPGLKIQVRQASLEERDIQKKTIFGLPFTSRESGEPLESKQRYFKGRDMVVRLEGVPIFYFPWVAGDIEDPLGPLEGISFGANRAFGFHIFTTWDIFDLVGAEKPERTRWHLLADVLVERGPALGSDFQSAGKDLFGIPSKYEMRWLAWGLQDNGTDIIGANRGTQAFINPTTSVPVEQPEWRGRVLGRLNVHEMPWGFSLQAQLGLLSDRNFMEQFYKQEFDNDLNQETSVYLKQQNERWAWTLLAEPRLRQFVTETEWLPRADGYLIGQKFFDLFTYNARGTVGYAQLRPAEDPTFPYSPTDIATNTGRFGVLQDLSLPFQAGPFKVVPYGVLGLTYYTNDLTGDDQGRVYGGGGVRSSIPFSKLYPNVESELFNLDGIYHKITMSSNWYIADSNTRFTSLPQLDRFNDDTTDQALRDIFPRQTAINPAYGAFLTSSPLFDPQFYALRRLIDTRLETLDRIDVIQLELRQRWQTKRGFPGNQHIIDWMTLGLGVSLFPESSRDNFGEPLGIIEYDWTWNIGDRTALVSDGWFETVENGPRVFNGGVVLNRPDNTNFYLGYRHIDPLESRAVVASLTYAFSAKYAITASTVWDFGVENEHYALMLTRIGTDVRVSFGVSYNSIIDSFGVQFEIVPNLIRRGTAIGPGAFNSATARR